MEGRTGFVELHGNPRQRVSSEDVIQAIRDVVGWLEANIPHYIRPAPDAQDFPDSHLTLLYSLHGGGLQLHDTFITLSPASIAEAKEYGSITINWRTTYIPFAKNSLDEFLIVDSESGNVLLWDTDSGVQEQVQPSLGAYFEDLSSKMLSHRFEYLDAECGLVERV
jgi:hypothetical protein